MESDHYVLERSMEWPWVCTCTEPNDQYVLLFKIGHDGRKQFPRYRTGLSLAFFLYILYYRPLPPFPDPVCITPKLLLLLPWQWPICRVLDTIFVKITPFPTSNAGLRGNLPSLSTDLPIQRFLTSYLFLTPGCHISKARAQPRLSIYAAR